MIATSDVFSSSSGVGYVVLVSLMGAMGFGIRWLMRAYGSAQKERRELQTELIDAYRVILPALGQASAAQRETVQVMQAAQKETIQVMRDMAEVLTSERSQP